MIQANWGSLVDAESADERKLKIEAVGVAVFHNLFAMAPAALDLFSFRPLHPTDDMNPKLRVHARTAFTAVDGLLCHLNSTEKTVSTLSSVVRGHLKYGVKELHYKVLLDAIVKTLGEALPAENWQEKQQEAWAGLAGAILGLAQQFYASQAEAVQPEI
jgi:hemoglobin-like flavoprotein